MRQPYKTDVAVLLLFFNRPETFRHVFDAVRQARPSQLFLYQDGARPGNARDAAGVEACRQICADNNIDWQCQVHRLFQEKNYGCDPSEYISQKWAFSMVDKCIVLEDDDVPSQSFFPFCKELLDRYEHDPRVWLVSGFNTDGVTPGVPCDYFFTTAFSIWGWASWRRVIDTWDESYSFLADDFNRRQLEALVKARRYRSDFMKMCADHAAQGKPFYESIFWASMLMNNGLAVMPTRNMVSNIGATADSTHYSPLSTMPRGLRRIFTMERHDVAFPLRHPRYVMEYVPYKEHTYRTNAWGHPWVKAARSLEELWLNLRHGHFSAIATAIVRRLRKVAGRDRHR